MKSNFRLALILVIVVLSVNALLADWEQVDGPYGGYINCFAMKGSNLFAGMYYGGVYRTSDRGAQWEAVNAGLGMKTINALTANTTTIFAGTNYGVFTSSNDGATWKQNRTGLTDKSIRSLTAIDSIIFAGTGGQGLYRSINNGVGWSKVDSGLTAISVYSLTNRETTIFAGTDNGIFFSEDNGESWTEADNNFHFVQIRCLATDGSIVYAGTAYGVYRSAKSGFPWVKVTTGLADSSVYSLAFSGSDLYAGTASGVFKTSNKGLNWDKVCKTRMPAYALMGTNADIFAGMYGSGILHSHDDGASWNTVNTGLQNATITALLPDSTGLIAGMKAAGCSYSPDGNGNWKTIDSVYNVTSLLMYDNSLLEGTENFGVHYYKYLNGAWGISDEYLGMFGMVNALASNGDLAFAATDHGVYYNNGSDSYWSSHHSGIGPGTATAVACSGSTLFTSNTNGDIYRSFDNGDNWYLVYQSQMLGNNCTAFVISDSIIIAGTRLGGLYRSADGGDSWDSANEGITFSGICALVCSGKNMFCSTVAGGIFLSTDDGQNWVEVGSESIEHDVLSLAVTDSFLYAGVQYSGIWKRPLSEMITSLENAETGLPVQCRLHQNFPNPFNPKTTFKYDIPENSYVNLSVYNLLGQKVATLVNKMQSAGNYHVNWDAGRFPSGVYLYKLTTDKGFSQTRKLMLLK